MKSILPTLVITALLLTAPCHALTIINETDFGDVFSFLALPPTTLTIESPGTTIINGASHDTGSDLFDFVLAAPTTLLTIEYFDTPTGGTASFNIGTGLDNPSPFDVFSGFLSEGLNVLPNLPAGAYTFDTNDGLDNLEYQITIVSVIPEPASVGLLAMGSLMLLRRRRRLHRI